LSDSFAICRTQEFPGCGNYYYCEIKSAKWENRCVNVLQDSLDVIGDKINNFTIIEKTKLITKALRDYAFRNIPYGDAVVYAENMRWKIVE
jgi:hypothetical protein